MSIAPADRHTLILPEEGRLEIRYYISEDAEEYHAHTFPPHVHDFLELYVLLEGDASFMVEQNIYPLSPGDIVVSKPNELHHCILNSRSRHCHACFWIDADSELIASPFLSSPKGEGNYIHPDPEDAKKLLYLMQQLNATNVSNDLLHGLSLAFDFLCIARQSIKTTVAAANESLPPILQTILEDIGTHYREIRDLDYFTDKYFISRSTLGRLFHQYLHTTPRLYLETKRLARSRQLLREGRSVTEACTEAGFCDCSHFIRLFRRRFDVTPLQYKNS